MKALIIALVVLSSTFTYGCSKERPTAQEIFSDIRIGSSNDEVGLILRNEVKSKKYNLTGASLIGPLGQITHLYEDVHGHEVEIRSVNDIVVYILHKSAEP